MLLPFHRKNIDRMKDEKLTQSTIVTGVGSLELGLTHILHQLLELLILQLKGTMLLLVLMYWCKM
jgi:hypothetical protein